MRQYDVVIDKSLTIVGPSSTSPLLKVSTPGNQSSSIVWIEDWDAAPTTLGALFTIDLSTGQGLCNLVAGAYNDVNVYRYGSTRAASRLALADNTIGLYVSSLASAGGQATGTAVTFYSSAFFSDSYICFYTGASTERLRIDSTGKVGIGTTTPYCMMDIVSPGNGTEAYFSVRPLNLTQAVCIGYNHIWEGGSVPNIPLYIDANGTGALVFQANGSTGNVGIGTASPQAFAALEVNTSSNRSIVTMDSVNGGLLIGYGGATIQGRTTGHGNGSLFLNYYGGNVAVGSGAPTAALHIKAGTATAGTAPLKLTAGTVLTTTEAGAIEYDGTHLYYTATNGGARVQLDSSGGTVTDLGTTSGTIALAVDSVYKVILNGNTVLTLPSPTSGKLYNIMFQFTMGAAYTVTVPVSVTWNWSTSPTLAITKRNRMIFDTIDGGVTWNGYYSQF